MPPLPARFIPAFLLILTGTLMLPHFSESQQPGEFSELRAIANRVYFPLPLEVDLDARKVNLGNRLFHDPRLSADNTVSCASCHRLRDGGVDNLPRSPGIHGALGDVNTPTVFNAVFLITQFWDGRARTLEDQIEGPVHNPKEMGSNWPQVIRKLNADARYVRSFNEIYREGITAHSIKDAIATFERQLITPSRFDTYLRGDDSALTRKEKQGFQRFVELKCMSCHFGINVGGGTYRKLGVYRDYFADRGNITQADYGHYNVTGREEDRFVFRVPTLRNVALTAPYFHDGTVKTLPDAVRLMGRYQLGQELSSQDVDLLVTFLNSLTGEYRGRQLPFGSR